MRMNVTVVGIVVNVLLLVGIIYLHFVAPRRLLKLNHPSEQKKVERVVKKLGLIVPSDQRRGIRDIMSGLIDTLEKQAEFQPEIKVYNANDSRALMRANIDAAIKDGVDVIVTCGSQAAQMTRELTAKRDVSVPTVFTMTGDPIKLELIKNLLSSGNNLTGVGVVGLDWIDQMIDVLPVIAPYVKKVFIPYDPTGLGGALEQYKQRFDRALERNNYQVSQVQIFATSEIGAKIPQFIPETDLIILLPDAVVVDGIQQIAKLAEQHGKAIYAALNLSLLHQGATFAFGHEMYDHGVVAAASVRKIIEQSLQPTNIPHNTMDNKFRIGMNADTARKQGVIDKIDSSVVFLMENGEVI